MCNQYSGQPEGVYTYATHATKAKIMIPYSDEIVNQDYIGSLGCIPNEPKTQEMDDKYPKVDMETFCFCIFLDYKAKGGILDFCHSISISFLFLFGIFVENTLRYFLK